MLIPALKVALILAVVLAANRLVLRLLRMATARHPFVRTAGGVLRGVVQGFILGVGALIILDTLGISITPILASLGVGSLAVALALQDTLANFFAGLHVLADRPIRVGDYVKLEGGQEGYVMQIGWRTTRLRTLPNNIVVLPNTKVANSIITNYALPEPESAVLIEVGVHGDSDLVEVERVTTEVARDVLRTVPGGVSAFEPFIRYHTFGDSSINFTVVLRAREVTDQHLLKHEFIKRLQVRYRQEGIVIPSPTRTIELAPDTVAALRGGRG